MEIVSFEEAGAAAWDAFCRAEPEAWLRHTSGFLAFAQTLGAESANVSFAFVKGGTIIAVVPLIHQQVGDLAMREFSMGGTPTPFPVLATGLSQQERHEVQAEIFAEIDTRAAADDVSLLRMFVDPLTDMVLEKRQKTNPLLQFGFHDTSIQTASVDLRRSEEDLLSAIQSRQRRYIRAAHDAGYAADFFDEKNITDDACRAFEDLYEKAAGRIVGTPERWRLTWDMVRKGKSIVLLVRAPNETAYCSGHVVMTYQGKAYDSLSAIAPSYRHVRGIGALMHWEIFKFLKHRGFTRFEVGWILPVTPGGPYTQKELDISHFKSMFGGELLPLWQGEKRYR